MERRLHIPSRSLLRARGVRQRSPRHSPRPSTVGLLGLVALAPASLALASLALASLVSAGCSDRAAESAGDAVESGAEVSVSAGGLVVVDPPDPERPWSVDLGHIPLGETREHVVRLRNVERRTLAIRSLQAGCSCTRTEISYVGDDGVRVAGDRLQDAGAEGGGSARKAVLRLPAGATAELLLAVDSRLAPLKNQPKLVIVRMSTDSEREPYLTLEVRLQVDTPFQVVPPVLDLRSIAQNAGGTVTASIVPVGDSHLRLTEVLSAPEGLSAELSASQQGDTEVWKLAVTLEPPIALGNQEYFVLLATLAPDGGEGRPFEVRVVANGVADVQVVPARFLLASDAPAERVGERADGRSRAGEAVETADLEVSAVELVSHLPGQKLLVRGARIEGAASERLRVELEPLSPDDDGRAVRWRVRLLATEDLGAGAVSGKVVLELEDPQFPALEIPYSRRAR